jgi:hypothetical protein
LAAVEADTASGLSETVAQTPVDVHTGEVDVTANVADPALAPRTQAETASAARVAESRCLDAPCWGRFSLCGTSHPC